jgi:DNA-binding HxlR family transcriptional regulator
MGQPQTFIRSSRTQDQGASATTPLRRREPDATVAPKDTEKLRKLHDAKQLFSGDWMNPVLVALKDGPKHYTELAALVRAMNSADSDSWSGKPRVLHDSVLTRTLKAMTADGLILRHQEVGAFPPSVQYAISTATAEALDALEPMVAWVDRHPDLIERAQRRRRGETVETVKLPVGHIQWC